MVKKLLLHIVKSHDIQVITGKISNDMKIIGH